MTAVPNDSPGAELGGRGPVVRAAVGIGVYAGALGLSFGAVSAGAGLVFWQTMVLSLLMFSGASQFAFVGVAAAGGTPFAAIPAALLLGVRNAFYGVTLSEILPRGPLWKRLPTAHLVIDESTAMAVGQPRLPLQRLAFWSCGVAIFVLWNLGTLAGALIGASLDSTRFGLDAAGPAAFLALLWPGLTTMKARGVAVGGALVALVLIPIAPAGVPVLCAALVALVAGLSRRGERSSGEDPLDPTDTAEGVLP
ncbi:MAG: AzlC family ABC transporter permease [Propionibacteriales bacterium]|nr:AzlC family ABC transporter permease [Propionibacteriales bacterium]